MCRFHNGGMVAPVSKHRLPRTVIPRHYELKLIPDLATSTYEGEVSIDIEVRQMQSEIVLNASGTAGTETNPKPDMVIHSAVLSSEDGTSMDGCIALDPANERVAVKLHGTAGRGNWKLTLKFSGTLNDKLKGFYRSRYNDVNGVERVLACTQFESTDARRAFPCFDEPALKSTFSVSLVVDEKLQAVSNCQVTKVTTVDGGKKQVDFARTMKMPTYVLAFVVGDLEVSKPISVDGVDVRIWTIPGKQHLTGFSKEIAAYSLRYFKKYFGRPYPGDKLDLLGIPDFAAGAMENLGCVTFRETALLVDPATASQAGMDRVAEVVAHEIAHMWFGDLVTMEWWDGLWLNEAFATFMAAKCVDSWKKAWGVWEKFALSRGAAMRTDALKATRPIQFTVNHPDEAAAMFDVLTYEKGCSVMRMLEQYLGEETFREGIALYMDRHAYGNTTGEDLWAALSESSGQDVAKIMEGWVYKPGFPVISVSKDDTAGSVTLGQRPFKFLAEAVDASQLWTVPVFLRAKTAEGIIEQKFLLADAEKTFHLGEGLEWVVVNAGGHGFVRVMYDAELASALTTKAMDTLSIAERYNLLADSWACVRAGMSKSDNFLAIAKLFAGETDPNVWAAIVGPLAGIRDMLPAANRPGYEAMVRGLLRPSFDRLGWTPAADESVHTRELRATIISALADTGNDVSVQKEAAARYAAWKADRSAVDPNLLSTLIGICASNGDAELHKEYFEAFRKAATPQEEQHFLGGLASFSDAALLKETLSHTLDPQKIRTQDAPFTVASVMRNDAGTEHAWDFIKANWDRMVTLYPESGLVRMCQAVSALDEPELEKDALAFFAAHEIPSGKKAIDQALEQLRINVLFKARESAPLCTAFAAPAAAPAVTE